MAATAGITDIQGAISKINELTGRVGAIDTLKLDDLQAKVNSLGVLQSSLSVEMNNLFNKLNMLNIPEIEPQIRIINSIKDSIERANTELTTLLGPGGGGGGGGGGGTPTSDDLHTARAAAAAATGVTARQGGGYRYGRYRSKSRSKSHKKRRRRHRRKKGHKTRSKRR